MIKIHSRPGGQTGIFLTAVLLLALAGCADYPAWSSGSKAPPVAQVQAGRGIRADWVYYPAYEIYYSSNYQQYVYWDTYDWYTRLEPRAPLTPEILAASPAVPMNFSDSPANHHATVTRYYPRDWRPPDNRLASARGY